MNTKPFLLLLVAFSTSLSAATQPAKPDATDVAFFTKLSKQLRGIPTTTLKDEKRSANIVNLIQSKLPDCGTVNKLEDAIEPLLDDAYPSNSNWKIVNVKQLGMGGKSKADVFFVFDDKGVKRAVVKAFRRTNGLVAELSSIALIKERRLPYVATPTPLAVGKCSYNDSIYGLLMETVASGLRLDQYLKNVATYPQGSPERDVSFSQALRAFSRAGTCLAEFNGLDKDVRDHIAKDGCLRVKLEIDRQITPPLLEKYAFDVAKIKKIVDQKLHKILAYHAKKFYRHGDAGLKNLFYDPAIDKLFLIDVARVHNGVKKSGEPSTNNLYDFIHLWKHLEMQATRLLSADEQKRVLDALYFGFVDSDNNIANLRHSNQSLYHALVQVNVYANFQAVDDPIERKRQRELFSFYCEFIKNYH